MSRIQLDRRLARAALARAMTIAAAGALAAPAQAAAGSRLWAWGSGNLGIGVNGTRVQAQPVHGLPAAAVDQDRREQCGRRLPARLRHCRRRRPGLGSGRPGRRRHRVGLGIRTAGQPGRRPGRQQLRPGADHRDQLPGQLGDPVGSRRLRPGSDGTLRRCRLDHGPGNRRQLVELGVLRVRGQRQRRERRQPGAGATCPSRLRGVPGFGPEWFAAVS
jgi:hypothetical protein